MTPTYLAVTLGPIYRTFLQAKRTRMLWSSSYLFSYWMRQVVESLKKEGFESNILIPHPKPFNPHDTMGAGVYPDRCIVQAKDGLDLERFMTIVRQTVETMSEQICRHIQDTQIAPNSPRIKYDEIKLKQDLAQYFQYSCVALPIAEGGNIPLSMYDQLDILELRQQWPMHYPDAMTHFLYRVNKGNSFLVKDAFEDKKRFESIVTIALRDLARSTKDGTKYKAPPDEYLQQEEENQKEDEQTDSECMAANQKEFGDDFKQFHKYVAVVYADGDGIGKILEQLGKKPDDLKRFSEILIDFNLAIVNTINNYGGAGIYLGGEDILMFLPVVCQDQCFFDLIQAIDGCFAEKFESLIADINAKIPDKKDHLTMPTLSWGVTIQYYKHPIWDGLKEAHDLMETAKDNDKHPGKNTIGIALRKHSGQTMKAFVQKNMLESYPLISNFFKDYRQDERLLKSITHKLRNPLFEAMLDAVAADEASLKQFFRNTFNESIHKTHADYLYETLPNLIHKVYKEYPKKEGEQGNNRRDVVYTMLRLVHFINSKPDTNEL